MPEVFPKIGIALGGGAAKATCQYGMLKKLIERKIPIYSIMGSSCGAIVGALYALQIDPNEVEERLSSYLKNGKIDSLMNTNFLHGSFFKADYIRYFLKQIFGEKTFADCKIPFACTAVDLESGEEVILREGKLWEAIMASCSIPGFFEPFYLNGRLLVDGGLLEDVPFSPMRREQKELDILIGMQIVDNTTKQLLAANIYSRYYKKGGKKNINFVKNFLKGINLERQLFLRIIDRTISILRESLFKYKVEEGKPDLLLKIDVEEYNSFDFKEIIKIIIRGEMIMSDYMPEFLKLIDEKKQQLNSPVKNAKLKKD